jgi:hypothetical protein
MLMIVVLNSMQESPKTPNIINEEKDEEKEENDEDLQSGSLGTPIPPSGAGEIIQGLTQEQWEDEINDINKLLPYAQLNKLFLQSADIVHVPYEKITSTCM